MSKIQAIGVVRLHGMLGDKNASAVAFWKKRALVVTDEITDQGNVVQVFEPDGADFRAAAHGLTVLDRPGSAVEEMDLEGIAVDGQTVFVLGSHSSKRKKVDAEKAYDKNRGALMSSPETQPGRDVLLRFELDAAGKAGPIHRTSLRGFLDTTEPFKSFGALASKENGTDVEGLAVRDQRIYVGFRGPVLRGNFTPVLRCRFGSPIGEPKVLFVNLGGRGVRDLARVEDGLLILAGPVGDGPGSYQLYLWDGRDGVPGAGAPTSAADPGLRWIGDLPIPPSDAGGHPLPAKPEGVALIKETSHHWEILVVFDGLKDGHATRFRVRKP
jgi:Protein of unknown function (DUF3616)